MILILTDEGLAIDLCRTVLVAGPTDEAANLWKELRVLADEMSSEWGQLQFAALVAELRSKFNLKEHPNFAFPLVANRTHYGTEPSSGERSHSRVHITAVESGH